MACLLTMEAMSDVEFDRRMLLLLESGRTIDYSQRLGVWFWYEKGWPEFNIRDRAGDNTEGISRPFQSYFEALNNAIGLPTTPISFHWKPGDPPIQPPPSEQEPHAPTP